MENRIENMKKEYQDINVPNEALSRIKQGINTAKNEKKISSFSKQKRIAAGIAAAFAVCIISVNSSPIAANAMSSIPVIGRIFEVITFRDYTLSNGNTSVSVKEPKVQAENSSAAIQVNADSSEYIDDLLAEFEEDCKDFDSDYASLDIDYSVITDTNDYFSLDIAAVDTGASGYEFHRFYTIDKNLDKVVSLIDLFPEGADYITPISDEIIRQMEAGPEGSYFIAENEEDGEGFSKISPEQNFYINEEGCIVICFEEYEVGPGSIGAPKFTIPKDITDAIK